MNFFEVSDVEKNYYFISYHNSCPLRFPHRICIILGDNRIPQTFYNKWSVSLNSNVPIKVNFPTHRTRTIFAYQVSAEDGSIYTKLCPLSINWATTSHVSSLRFRIFFFSWNISQGHKTFWHCWSLSNWRMLQIGIAETDGKKIGLLSTRISMPTYTDIFLRPISKLQ